MCDRKEHTCYCKKVYPCTVPNWMCSTNNGDEDANMCDECLEQFGRGYEDFVAQETLLGSSKYEWNSQD